MDETKPPTNWTIGVKWHVRDEVHSSDGTYWLSIRNAYQDNLPNRTAIRNNRVPHTHVHHALIGNCSKCFRVGIVGMRCSCNSDNTVRYIKYIRMGVLRGETDMDPPQPDPVKLCMFYYSIDTPAHRQTEDWMSEREYIIARPFTPVWDNLYAHPAQAWTLDKFASDEFYFSNLDDYWTLQSIMTRVFFETEQPIRLRYLENVIEGLNWEYCINAAGETIERYFKEQQITSERQKEDWMTRLEGRGLDSGIRAWQDTQRQHERDYQAWVNSRV